MRSTEDKLIHIPMTVGMNQSVSTRLAPTGTFDLVQNCRTSGNGVLEKRPGTTALSLTTANSPTHALAGDTSGTNREAPCFACQVQASLMVGNSYGDAFAFSTVWQFQGRFSTCLPVRKRYGLAVDDTMGFVGIGNGFGRTPPDSVVTQSGYIGVCALTFAGNLHFYIEDPNGVRIYYLNGDVAVRTRARLVAQGDTIYLIQQVGTILSILDFTISAGTVSTPAVTAIGGLSSATAFWDVSAFDSQTRWHLALQTAAAVVTLIEISGTTASGTTTFACTGEVPLTLWADPAQQQLWVGFYDDPVATGNVKYSVWSIPGLGSITAVKAATILKTGLFLGPPMFGRYRGVAANTTKKAFYCFKQLLIGGANTAATWVGAAFGSATAPTTPVACWHVVPISKPDNFNRVWCIINSTTGILASNQLLTRAVLLRFADETLKATPTIELSGPNTPMPPQDIVSDYAFFSTIAVPLAGGVPRNYFALPTLIQQFYGLQAISKIDVYEYTTADQEPHRQTTRFGVTTTVAGQPVEFWGQSVSTIDNASTSGNAGAFAGGASEIGFPHAPIIFSITKSNTGAGFQAIGTRSWRVTFEWVDMYGRRHQSAPSAPVSSTSDASHVSATLVISTTDITQRQSSNTRLRVCLKIYRTVAGGTEYHECATTAVAFDQSSGLITFIDFESDDNIAQNGFLYTDGGVLDDTLAPSCRFTCKSEDRMWFGGLWDANIIQCSKVIVPGEPIQCTDDFSHQVQLPAPCTGLAYMDGNVVAFTTDGIYLVGGDGPNDQGAGSFPPPRCLTRSVSCVDYRSVVETNLGVMFQANIGLYLLPRGFGPAQYVGVGVQDEMTPTTADTNATVYGAISHVTRGNHLARFLVTKDSGPPFVLTYDLDSSQWFKDTFGGVTIREIGAYDSQDPNTGIKGAVLIRGELTNSIDGVFVESTAAINDASGTLAITQEARTAWIHPFGLGGFGKVNCILFAVEATDSSQDLQILVQTDANTQQSCGWTITTSGSVSYRMYVIGDSRACSAVQVSIFGVPPAAGTAGGFKFISCTLEVEPTAGIRLLSDAEKN